MTRTHSDFKIIAHRGASGYAPENTLAAFSKAVLLGVKSVEFDVQETKDHQLVVIHDPDLKRVAGDKRLLTRLDYSELATLDAGSWFDAGFCDEHVPTLEQVLDLFGKASPDIELQLEIKDGKKPYPGIEQRVLEALRLRTEWDGRVIVSSFNLAALRRVRQLAPMIRLGYLVGRTGVATVLKEATELACESVHLSLRQASTAWAEAVHAAGMRFYVYTVDSKNNLDRMRRIGADGVFSDFPDIGLKVTRT